MFGNIFGEYFGENFGDIFGEHFGKHVGDNFGEIFGAQFRESFREKLETHFGWGSRKMQVLFHRGLGTQLGKCFQDIAENISTRASNGSSINSSTGSNTVSIVGSRPLARPTHRPRSPTTPPPLIKYNRGSVFVRRAPLQIQRNTINKWFKQFQPGGPPFINWKWQLPAT